MVNSYRSDAQKILKAAMERREGKSIEGYQDRKAFVTLDEMTALIGDGATIISLNNPQFDVVKRKSAPPYFHEVLFGGHDFIAASDTLYSPVIEPCRRF